MSGSAIKLVRVVKGANCSPTPEAALSGMQTQVKVQLMVLILTWRPVGFWPHEADKAALRSSRTGLEHPPIYIIAALVLLTLKLKHLQGNVLDNPNPFSFFAKLEMKKIRFELLLG